MRYHMGWRMESDGRKLFSYTSVLMRLPKESSGRYSVVASGRIRVVRILVTVEIVRASAEPLRKSSSTSGGLVPDGRT